jgi:sortase A
MRWLRQLERVLLILGMMLLAVYGAARIHRTVLSKADLQLFKARQLVSAEVPHPAATVTGRPDFRLWSVHRVKDYQASLAEYFAPAIAILLIPKIQLEVPILEGTDDLSLNRGVGHVAGSASPGQNGNVAIAGHRDGFFRGLKDISLGDEIAMITPDRTETFIIDRITIVDRQDVSVLKPRRHKSLTLVTCYPFYFVGSAPRRYIVQASVTKSAPNSMPAVGQQRPDPAF